MDQDRFDEFTKSLGKSTSRRNVLKILGGGAVAGIAAIFGGHRSLIARPDEVVALAVDRCPNLDVNRCLIAAFEKYQEEINECDEEERNPGCVAQATLRYLRDQERCRDHRCPPLTQCLDGRVCCPNDWHLCGVLGETCFPPSQPCCGSTVCSTGQLCCNGLCVNPSTDNNNCGGCGIVCLGGQQCIAGICACPDNEIFCNGLCIDPLTDNNNCGNCGNACQSPRVCVVGVCACPGGGTVCGNQCCNAGETCCNGACCPVGEACCNGTCRSLNDEDNCGACGNVCSGCQQCVNGTCQNRCQTCETCVNGNCAPITCGPCQECDPATGACRSICPSGVGCCFGQCCPSGRCCPTSPSSGTCCPTTPSVHCCIVTTEPPSGVCCDFATNICLPDLGGCVPR